MCQSESAQVTRIEEFLLEILQVVLGIVARSEKLRQPNSVRFDMQAVYTNYCTVGECTDVTNLLKKWSKSSESDLFVVARYSHASAQANA